MVSIEKQLAVNPYQLPKPDRSEILYEGKFYHANKKGTYGMGATSFQLALCNRYIWIDEGLSIPLSDIIETGLTKKGGFIRFLDRLAGEVMDFYFTKLGFIGFRQEEVKKLLEIIDENLPADRPKLTVKPDSSGFELPGGADAHLHLEAPPVDVSCEECDEKDVYVLVFKELRFFGLAPVAYIYRLTPVRSLLCRDHAKKRAAASCYRTAMYGYLGFPGFLAAPWYVIRNLWELRRAKAADIRTVLETIFMAIILPLGLLVVAVWAIWYFSPPV